MATLWTEQAKAEIRSSRVVGTAGIARAAAEAFVQSGKPRALICSSAIGYYGSRGDEELVEESEAGAGFLAEVCRDWESRRATGGDGRGSRGPHAHRPGAGHRRRRAGQNASAFRLGVAGRLGSGRQWWSWISRRDAVRAFVFAVENEQVHGALNVASANAVTNREFTRTLGRVLHRPTLLAVPAFVLRALAGEMGEEMLLASQRVIPKRLLEAGFSFEDAELEPALRKLLR